MTVIVLSVNTVSFTDSAGSADYGYDLWVFPSFYQSRLCFLYGWYKQEVPWSWSKSFQKCCPQAVEFPSTSRVCEWEMQRLLPFIARDWKCITSRDLTDRQSTIEHHEFFVCFVFLLLPQLNFSTFFLSILLLYKVSFKRIEHHLEWTHECAIKVDIIYSSSRSKNVVQTRCWCAQATPMYINYIIFYITR